MRVRMRPCPAYLLQRVGSVVERAADLLHHLVGEVRGDVLIRGSVRVRLGSVVRASVRVRVSGQGQD